VNRTVHAVIHDAHGRPVLVIGTREFTIIEPDGTISEYQESDSIQLVDGLAWSPAMMSQANPILLTSCAACRNPPVSLFLGRAHPTHGLLAVRNARVCVECGTVCCPQHRRLSGEHWRCIPCWRKHGLKGILRPLFFRREEVGR
jgi:hypothetical protein